MATGVKSFERQVPLLLDDEQAEIPALSRDSLRVMWSAYVASQARIKELEQALVAKLGNVRTGESHLNFDFWYKLVS